MSEVIVSNKCSKRIRNGHLWGYKSEIKKIKASGGQIVSVYDEADNFVGKAFYSDSSEIALRFLTRKDEEIDEEFWFRRINQAINLRRSLVKETNAFRLINAEGDLIPSLIVDYYNDVLIIQTLSQGTEKLKNLFVKILKDELNPRSVIEKNNVNVRLLEKLEPKEGLIHGENVEETLINQNGFEFLVSFSKGQKTGMFLDQRENYLVARKFAKGKALDCFCFTGGFAINIASCCEKVIAVDISEVAMDLAKRNAKQNRLQNIDFYTANVFDFLRDLDRANERFDLVILDPPAFAKNRESVKKAIRGYKEINLRAMKILNQNGILITCSCSFHFTEELFLETLISAAKDVKRRIHLIEKRYQSSDHPILLGMPETLYLKCFVLRVFD